MYMRCHTIYEQCALISAGAIAPDLTGRRIYAQARTSDSKEKKHIKNKGNIPSAGVPNESRVRPAPCNMSYDFTTLCNVRVTAAIFTIVRGIIISYFCVTRLGYVSGSPRSRLRGPLQNIFQITRCYSACRAVLHRITLHRIALVSTCNVSKGLVNRMMLVCGTYRFNSIAIFLITSGKVIRWYRTGFKEGYSRAAKEKQAGGAMRKEKERGENIDRELG